MILRILCCAILQFCIIGYVFGVVPQITRLNVQCDRTGMKVNVEFDNPFNGIIFSKGHYSDPNCRWVAASSSRRQFNFYIATAKCGTIGTDMARGSSSPQGFKNVIIIQNDPDYQEVWDSARKLSCDWVTRLEKYVTFAPFGVDMLGVKELRFPGDTVDCWMDIQRGHGPFAPSVGGVVPIGEKLTVVIYVRDTDSSFDVHVKDCYAYDSSDYRSPNARAIKLTDERGCAVKEKLVQGFYRTRDVRTSGATIIAYGIINAFKFPERMDVFLACNVEVCKGSCPDNDCQPEVAVAGADEPAGEGSSSTAAPSTDEDDKEQGTDDEKEEGGTSSTTEATDTEKDEEEKTEEGEDSGTGTATEETESSEDTSEKPKDEEKEEETTEEEKPAEEESKDEEKKEEEEKEEKEEDNDVEEKDEAKMEEEKKEEGGDEAKTDEEGDKEETKEEDEKEQTKEESKDEAKDESKDEDEEEDARRKAARIKLTKKSKRKSKSKKGDVVSASKRSVKRPSRKNTSTAKPKAASLKRGKDKDLKIKKVKKTKSKSKSSDLRAAPSTVRSGKEKSKVRARIIRAPSSIPAVFSRQVREMNRAYDQMYQREGRHIRSRRSVTVLNENATFPAMMHSISIISPIEDLDEKELTAWEKMIDLEGKAEEVSLFEAITKLPTVSSESGYCFTMASLLSASLLMAAIVMVLSTSAAMACMHLRSRSTGKMATQF